MATETRRGAKGKEKRGISASPSPSPSTSSIRRSSRPLSSSSNRTTPNSSGDHERPRTPTTEVAKPVPNYLKPTISSIPKRAVGDNAALGSQTLKPALNRMRSFDRAPPSPQVQRATRGSSNLGARDIRTTRSSSFSHKSTTSPSSSASASTSLRSRPTSSDRVGVRTASRGGKLESSSSSRNLKKNALLSSTTKRDPARSGGSSTKKPPKSVVSEPCMNNHGTNYETSSIGHHLDIDVDDHDMVNLDDDLQSLPEISEMPDSGQELGDPTTLDKVEVQQDHPMEFEPVEESYDYKEDEVPPVEEDYEQKSEVQVQEITTHHNDDDDQHDYHKTNEQEKSRVENQDLKSQVEEVKHPDDQEVIVKEELSVDHHHQVHQGVGDQDGLVQEVGPIVTLPAEVPKLEVAEEIKAEEEIQTPAPTPTKTQETELPTLKEEKPAEEKDEKQPTPTTENTEKSATPTTTEEKNETLATPTTTTEEKNETLATPTTTEEKSETPATPTTTEEKNEIPATPTTEEKSETPATPTTTEEKNEKPATPTEETKEKLETPTTEEKNEKPVTPTPATEEKNEKPTTTAATTTNKTTTGSSGKKENQQAYNDVIKETSKKLMGGNRRNKVLALAGAFETVISLQDSSPSKK